MVLYGLKEGWWETPTGYVSADWISLDKVSAPVVVDVKWAVVSARAGLNVRKSPCSAKVSAIKDGTKVRIYEQSGYWYRIGSGRWVSAMYLE